MTHYAVVQIITTNAHALTEYRAHAADAVRKHGGRPFAGGPGSEVLEDFGAGATTNVIAAFPSAEAAHDWMNDPDLSEIHALRRKGAKTTITLLPELA